MATREELKQKNKDELQDLAQERDIDGRSSMNKDELVAALADDGEGDDGEDDNGDDGDVTGGVAQAAGEADVPRSLSEQASAEISAEGVEATDEEVGADDDPDETDVRPAVVVTDGGQVRQVKQVHTR